MATLLTAYPSAPRTDDDLKLLRALWIDVLEDVPDELLQSAAREYTRSDAQFAPAPGQLRTRALQLAHSDTNELAEKAWQGVVDCNYGREPQYLIDADLSREIMRRLGGFDRMGETPSEWINKNWREPFLKMYADLKQRKLSNTPSLPAFNPANLLPPRQQKVTYEDKRERLLRQAEAMNARQ